MSDTLYREVGRLDGRLSALESRTERLESTIMTRLDLQVEKLDRIEEALALRQGARTNIGNLIKWGLALATAVSGWVYGAANH